MFYAIVFTIFAANLLWCFLSARRARTRRPAWVGWAALGFGIMQIAVTLIMTLSRGSFADVADATPRWLFATVLVWNLLLLPVWLLWQAGAGISAIAKRITKVPPRAPSPSSDALSRREFFGAAAVMTPPLLSLGAAAVGELQLDDFRVRRLTVSIPNLPPALDGLTIAHVTDVHVGRFTRGKVLERIVEETNRLDADFVALTGDLINDSLRALPPALEMVRGFRARHGVISCEGNHDLIESKTAFYRDSEKGGLPLLRNETATMTVRGQRVQFLGLPWNRDGLAQERSVAELLAKREADAWQVMLAHHPHAWEHADGVPLTLAGHTHGGQLMVSEQSGFGPMFYRYWSGIYTRRQGDSLVVSNGTGNWFPVRIHAPAEILHLTLRPAMAASASSSEKSAGSSSRVSGGGARI